MNENIVDILVTIDVDTILESNGKTFDGGNTLTLSQHSATPTQLYNYYSNGQRLSDQVVYMVARRDNTDGPDGGSELAVNLRQGDIVLWRATSLSKGMYNAVLLYQYTQTNPVPSAGNPPYLTDVTPIVLDSTPLPIIDKDNPAGQPIAQSVQNYYWQANATRVGSRITYTWAFMILDSNNKVIAYCSWDPYFSIH